MSAAISQLSLFSNVNRTVQFRTRSQPFPILRPKVLAVLGDDSHGTDVSTSQNPTSLSYTTDESKSYNRASVKPYPASEGYTPGNETVQGMNEPPVDQPKQAAKIHDFCFGIPYGGLVLSGGLLGFIFSRNLATLSNGVLFGGGLLALSTISLKVWRQGKSSLPFILGQAVLAASLLWKNLQSYSSTKKVFPTSLYAVISAAMLCFYSYVVISGGNPPPKKKSSAATPA